MIYWPITADALDCYIPNATGYTPADGDPDLFLELRSNVNLTAVTMTVTPASVTPLYFRFSFDGWTIPDGMVEGEYTYTLRLGEGGVVLGSGLLIVGDYAAEREQYDKSIEYEQYGNESSYQQAEISR